MAKRILWLHRNENWACKTTSTRVTISDVEDGRIHKYGCTTTNPSVGNAVPTFHFALLRFTDLGTHQDLLGQCQIQYLVFPRLGWTIIGAIGIQIYLLVWPIRKTERAVETISRVPSGDTHEEWRVRKSWLLHYSSSVPFRGIYYLHPNFSFWGFMKRGKLKLWQRLGTSRSGDLIG